MADVLLQIYIQTIFALNIKHPAQYNLFKKPIF